VSTSSSLGVLSKRYATALFELSANNMASAEKDAKSLLAACAEKSFHNFLNNPTLSRAQQAAVLEAMLPAGDVQKLALRVAKNRRLPALPDILRAYLDMVAASRGEIKVVAESAQKLSEKETDTLATGLGKALSKRIELQVKHAPELLGGVRLKLGNTMIDYSVENALNRLGNTLKSTQLGA
jgi:F-type H+-transporting ATPase subunit delta